MTPSFRRSGDLRRATAALVWAGLAFSTFSARGAGKTSDFEIAYNTAITLFDSGAYAEALTGFARAYALEPRPEAVYMLARCQHALDRFEEAAAGYERVLAEAGGHAVASRARWFLIDVLRALGQNRLAGKDFPGAKATFERALVHHAAAGEAVAVTRAELLAGLAEALLGLGDDAGARTTFEEALGAATAPDLRARIEARLAEASRPKGKAAAGAGTAGFGGAGTRPGPPSGGTRGAGLTAPGAGEGTPPPKRAPVGLYFGIGGAAAAVVAAAVVVAAVVLSARLPRTDLGWQTVGLEGR